MIRYNLPSEAAYQYDRYVLNALQLHNEALRFKKNGEKQETIETMRTALTTKITETRIALSNLESQLSELEDVKL